MAIEELKPMSESGSTNVIPSDNTQNRIAHVG